VKPQYQKKKKKKKSLHSKCLKISSVMYVTKHPLY
jgi:hypothetical protein